ncbi:MAG: ATPase, T2SS/T4P/T4SS family [Candidatus Nanopelagicales bacterium]
MEFELSNKKIENLLLDKTVEEIMINGPGRVYVVRAGISTLSELFVSEDEIDVLIEQLLKNTGRRVDKSHPFVDASLPDGSRLHIVIPDITRRFPAINIRKFPQLNLNLRDFISQGVLSNQQADFLEFAVTSGANIVVAGGTGAGKTTFLRALLNTQEGSINLSTNIFLSIIFASITVAVNINFLTSQRQNLQQLIDQAALAAVQEIDLPSYYESGLTKNLMLDKAKAKKMARDFIDKNSSFQQSIDLKVTFTENELFITGELPVSLPLAPELIQVPIRASAGARLVVGF